jgi:hypothetical protein
MSLLDRAKKLQKLRGLNAKITMTWINDVGVLTIAQIESTTDIFIYLEI